MQKTILSTADVARMFNVTETTIKRWADEGTLKCQKTPGGHRKFDYKAVVEFAENSNMVPSGTLNLGAGEQMGAAIEAAVLMRDFPALAGVLLEKLLASRTPNVYTLLSYMYGHRIQLHEIFDRVIRPAMQEVGTRWMNGEIGINHEHRASAEIMGALARLQADVLIKPSNDKRVLLACVGEEQHEIGLRCAAYLLEAEGWSVYYYGARTPVPALVSAILELKPAMLCVSVSAYGGAATDGKDLRVLNDAAHAEHAQMVVGGSGATRDLQEKGFCDSVVTSSLELLHLSAGLHEGAAADHHRKP